MRPTRETFQPMPPHTGAARSAPQEPGGGRTTAAPALDALRRRGVHSAAAVLLASLPLVLSMPGSALGRTDVPGLRAAALPTDLTRTFAIDFGASSALERIVIGPRARGGRAGRLVGQGTAWFRDGHVRGLSVQQAVRRARGQSEFRLRTVPIQVASKRTPVGVVPSIAGRIWTLDDAQAPGQAVGLARMDLRVYDDLYGRTVRTERIQDTTAGVAFDAHGTREEPAPEVLAAIGRLSGTTMRVHAGMTVAGHEDILFIAEWDDGVRLVALGDPTLDRRRLSATKAFVRLPDGRMAATWFGPDGLPSATYFEGTYTELSYPEMPATQDAEVTVRLRARNASGADVTTEIRAPGRDVWRLAQLQAAHGLMEPDPGVRGAPGAAAKPENWREALGILLRVHLFSFSLGACAFGLATVPAGGAGVVITAVACGTHALDWAELLRGENPFEEPPEAGNIFVDGTSCLVEGMAVPGASLALCTAAVGASFVDHVANGPATPEDSFRWEEMFDEYEVLLSRMDETISPTLEAELMGVWTGAWQSTIHGGAGGCTYENGGACTVVFTGAAATAGAGWDVLGTSTLHGIDVRRLSDCSQAEPVSGTQTLFGHYRAGTIAGTFHGGAAAFRGLVVRGRFWGTFYRNGSPYGAFELTR